MPAASEFPAQPQACPDRFPFVEPRHEAQARIEGNIYYKVLEMAAGAQVCGHLVREDEPRRQLARPAEIEVVAEVVKEARRA